MFKLQKIAILYSLIVLITKLMLKYCLHFFNPESVDIDRRCRCLDSITCLHCDIQVHFSEPVIQHFIVQSSYKLDNTQYIFLIFLFSTTIARRFVRLRLRYYSLVFFYFLIKKLKLEIFSSFDSFLTLLLQNKFWKFGRRVF